MSADRKSWGWFEGKPETESGEAQPTPKGPPVDVTSVDRKKLFGPHAYSAAPELVSAVNTALVMGMPLLLTGEPGTGKSQLAEKLAIELRWPYFKFETRSTSVAQDLFYTYDHIGRFHAAHDQKASTDPKRYIQFEALGRALVQSLAPHEARQWFTEGSQPPAWWDSSGAWRSVVLIDEIDKAPSDFPNDLLNAIDHFETPVHELESTLLKAGDGLRPAVIITSNSEKQLPDAFLRRCIFHHVRPPTRTQLEDIVRRRLSLAGIKVGEAKLKSVIDLHEGLRDEGSGHYDLRKKPAAGELLAFLAALSQLPGYDPQAPLRADDARAVLSTLVKAPEDLEPAGQHPMLQDAKRTA